MNELPYDIPDALQSAPRVQEFLAAQRDWSAHVMEYGVVVQDPTLATTRRDLLVRLRIAWRRLDEFLAPHMEVALSEKIEQYIRMMFEPEQQEAVRSELLCHCGRTVPGFANRPAESINQFRMKLLQASLGDIAHFERLISMVNVDYREVLGEWDITFNPEETA